MDSEAVAPVDVARQPHLQLAGRREGLPADELCFENLVRRPVDGVVAGAALAEGDLSTPNVSSMMPISASSNPEPRSAWNASMPEIGSPRAANAALTSRASFPGPAERPTTSLLQRSASKRTRFRTAPIRQRRPWLAVRGGAKEVFFSIARRIFGAFLSCYNPMAQRAR